MSDTNQHSSHKHPNYVALWAVLLALLFVGIAAGGVGHAGLSTVLIFGVAALKAYMVALNYMHLKYESAMVRVLVIGGISCLLILLIALLPDVVYVYGD